MTEINRNMNIVVTTEAGEGEAYVHSRPLSKEAMRANRLVLGKAFAAIFTEGYGVIAGPGVAYELLREVAGERWEGASGVRNTLVNEIIRNSEAIIPEEEQGWTTCPLEVAISRGLIDEDDVLGELIFFTCIWAISKPAQARITTGLLCTLWSSVCTSSNATEWMHSLPTSKDSGPSGATESTS